MAAATAAWSLAHSGELERATELAAEAIDAHRALGDRSGEGHAHDTQGLIHYQLGRYAQAVAAYRRALACFQSIGDLYFQARVLTRLAQTEQAWRGTQEALPLWREALRLFEELGSPDAETTRDALLEATALEASEAK
jgi:tetratricopeptide (TPR) repeat protein